MNQTNCEDMQNPAGNPTGNHAGYPIGDPSGLQAVHSNYQQVPPANFELNDPEHF